ncbi:complex I subunit 4 family protein [Actinomarinicola tropica]|uniref:NADH-quinone oxidoreductase subunit M n=1 Tax=Actinomarinicola tropica TaxID=2789776 RepID=A0A5Q2RID8_9ACTN|nr:NADH-quinone oxidoreductase subunit M [Actinomarinicola tropica]QGG94136.1 NADH-quinone oxidoreductase subunit M [Actinomarinicola tropica]
MLTLAIFLPIAAAAVFALLPRRLRSDVDPARDDPWTSRLRLVASVVGAVPLLILLGAWARFDGGGGFELVESSEWIPTLGVGYRVGIDGLSLPLALMTAFVFAVAIAYPVDLRGRPGPYYALMLFLEGVSVGLFLSLDLFLFFVFWDLSLVGIYFLIGAWGHGDARRSALKFFVYTFAGSLALLLAILGLYLATEPRTFDMAEIIRQQPLPAGGVYATLVFLGFFIGFGVKTPVVPFHTWLPPAHVDAPGPASAVLAGVLLKMGTYGFVRVLMSMQPETFARFAFPIGVVAVVSIVYGALVAMAQTNLKRLIAYTSVNHMGYVMLGLAAAGASIAGQEDAQALALTGATLEMVAHGLITGALFLVSGSILARGDTYEMDAYGGLAGRAPALTGITVVAAFASLGLPGLAGFVAEFQVFAGALAVYPWLAGIGLLGIVITAALFLRMLQQVFLGPLPERWTEWPDLGWIERLTLGTLILLIIGIGVAPALLLDVIDTFAGPFVGR